MADTEIKAGVTLSLSGRFADQGRQAQRGLTLWAEHQNEGGGLRVRTTEPPRPLALVIHDDASRRAGAASGTERLLRDDRVDLLFSPYSSVLALAAAEVAERHGRVMWNHGGSSDALNRAGLRWPVNLLTPASAYFGPVLDLVAHHARVTSRQAPNGPRRGTAALLYGASGTFPRAVAEGARVHAARLGHEIVLDAPYPEPSPAPHALTTLLRDIARLQPDAVLGVGSTDADLAFAREARRQHLTAPLVALVAAPVERFRQELGTDADGFCGPSQWEPALRDRPDIGPSSTRFAADFRQRFGAEPDYPAAQAYAAGLIAAHCVQAAGSLDDVTLRRAALTLDLTTFYGRFRLDPRTGQQVGHAMVVCQWQAGRKQVVWPPDAATATLQIPCPTAAPSSRPSDDAPSS